jgi:hypothetical protein
MRSSSGWIRACAWWWCGRRRAGQGGGGQPGERLWLRREPERGRRGGGGRRRGRRGRGGRAAGGGAPPGPLPLLSLLPLPELSKELALGAEGPQDGPVAGPNAVGRAPEDVPEKALGTAKRAVGVVRALAGGPRLGATQVPPFLRLDRGRPPHNVHVRQGVRVGVLGVHVVAGPPAGAPSALGLFQVERDERADAVGAPKGHALAVRSGAVPRAAAVWPGFGVERLPVADAASGAGGEPVPLRRGHGQPLDRLLTVPAVDDEGALVNVGMDKDRGGAGGGVGVGREGVGVQVVLPRDPCGGLGRGRDEPGRPRPVRRWPGRCQRHGAVVGGWAGVAGGVLVQGLAAGLGGFRAAGRAFGVWNAEERKGKQSHRDD